MEEALKGEKSPPTPKTLQPSSDEGWAGTAHPQEQTGSWLGAELRNSPAVMSPDSFCESEH